MSGSLTFFKVVSDREDLLAQLAEMTEQMILSVSQLEIAKGIEHQLQAP